MSRGTNPLRAAWDWLLGRNAGANTAPGGIDMRSTRDTGLAPEGPSERQTAGPHPRGASAARPEDQRSPRSREVEVTAPFTLARVRRMLTDTMGYSVQRVEDADGHPTLGANWNGFPFVIEEPEDHEGTLLVTGEWDEPAAPGQRDEIAASINDWNREKFFPTVSIVDTPVGPIVRAMYLVDLSSGATNAQLRLHLDTALSSCTQALEHVAPLLPEL